jgi:hypothetical protein
MLSAISHLRSSILVDWEAVTRTFKPLLLYQELENTRPDPYFLDSKSFAHEES